MKIAIFSYSLSAGGAERVISRMANYWAGAGIDVCIFTFEKVEEDFYTLHPLVRREVIEKAPRQGPFYSMPLRVIKRIFYIRRELARYSPDIAISVTTFINVLSIIAARSLNIPILVRETTMPSVLMNNGWKGRVVKYLYKFLYPYADAVICPARLIETQLKERFGLTNTALIYNPVDVDDIRRNAAMAKNVTSIESEKIQFVCAGRLIEAKGYDRLIDMLGQCHLPKKWSLTIYGDGEERSTLQDLVRDCGLEERIILAGTTMNPWAPMASADAFLLPSRWEGMPNVVLESLAVGTPVIAMAEAGGIEEIAMLAPVGAVTVVSTINAFVKAMGNVTSGTEKVMRPSLLPSEFEAGHVMGRIQYLLGSKDELL